MKLAPALSVNWTSLRLHRGASFTLAALLMNALTVNYAFAVPIDVPGSVSPGQVERRFDQGITRPESPDLQITIPTDAEISKEALDQLAKQKFLLKQVSIEGLSVYTGDALEKTYSELIGKTISLLDARSIARDITKIYRNDGYILTQAVVPTQDVTDGTLKIRIVEGFIGEVTTEGDVKTAGEHKVIDGFAEKMKSQHPVRTQDLERYLLLINDLSGTHVSGLLRPLQGQFGAAELVLSITHKSYEGSYTLDNRGSKFIGPWQHTAMLAGNSMFGMFERTQARAFFASPEWEELLGFELSHELPIDSEGTKLALLASNIRTNPQDSLSSLDIRGSSYLFQAKVTHPFIRMRKENLLGRFSLDYRDVKTDIFDNEAYTKDRLRVARLGGTYNLIDKARGNNLIDLQISQGMNIFSATSNGDDRSNAVGDSSFTKANLEVSRLQTLPYNFSVLVAGSGQYSFDPLLTDEQFGIGGSEYARAFDSSSSLGDSGVAGKTELRYTETVGSRYFDYFQLYSFYDIGRTWVRDAEPGANNKTIRSSTGGGVRLFFTENFSANFEADVPLIKPSDDATDYRHNPRLFMSVTARF